MFLGEQSCNQCISFFHNFVLFFKFLAYSAWPDLQADYFLPVHRSFCKVSEISGPMTNPVWTFFLNRNFVFGPWRSYPSTYKRHIYTHYTLWSKLVPDWIRGIVHAVRWTWNVIKSLKRFHMNRKTGPLKPENNCTFRILVKWFFSGYWVPVFWPILKYLSDLITCCTMDCMYNSLDLIWYQFTITSEFQNIDVITYRPNSPTI